MTTIVVFSNYAAESVLCVRVLVAYIGAGEWIPGTINAKCPIYHLIMLVVCRMDGNFMAVATCFLVLPD